MSFLNKILIFTDGACSGNPGPGGYGAIVVFPEGKVQEFGRGEKETTNNRMEMSAVIRALTFLKKGPKRNEALLVLTDSTYIIRGITQWIWGWKKRGWKNSEGEEVSNKDLWLKLEGLVKSFQIEWGYVRGHQGVPGNERCDQIAVAFSKGQYIELYSGDLLQYDVAVYDIPESIELPPVKNFKEGKKKAYSYLSYVDGALEVHKTWPECEARVKGRSGAKFKKALSPEDEEKIKAEWGL